jgi:hypothetical protein
MDLNYKHYLRYMEFLPLEKAGVTPEEVAVVAFHMTDILLFNISNRVMRNLYSYIHCENKSMLDLDAVKGTPCDIPLETYHPCKFRDEYLRITGRTVKMTVIKKIISLLVQEGFFIKEKSQNSKKGDPLYSYKLGYLNHMLYAKVADFAPKYGTIPDIVELCLHG